MVLFGGFVGVEHVFASGEGTHHHEESGFGQVKVGDDGIDDTPAIAGVDEEVGVAIKGCDRPPRTDVADFFGMGGIASGTENSRRFECAGAGRANGDNTASGKFGLVDDASVIG